METKKMYRFFNLAQFIEEQEFLMEQHRQGWKFVSLTGLSCYTFEKVTPEEYVYQLDYKESAKDEDVYLQLFKDCHWEYLGKVNNYYYFRKSAETDDLDLSIFSDTKSKINMCKKIIKKQLFIFFVLIAAMILITHNFILDPSDHSMISSGVTFLIFYLIIISLHLRIFLKLQKMIKLYQNDN